MEELAGTGAGALEVLGLNGSLSERMCQEAIRTLRATADLAGFGFAVAALDVGVEPVPGVRRPPGVLGGLDGSPAQHGGTGLG